MLTLANQLRAEGHRVEFGTFKGRGLGDHVRRLGFPVIEVPVRIKVDPWGILNLAQWIRREKFDLVHSHLSTSAVNGALAARLAGVPSVATVHGMSGKLSFVASDHLIAVSSEVRNHLVTQGIHESKISIVPNGISFTEPTLAARERARQKLGLPLGSPVFGTTARLTALKGVDHAIYAFARVVEDFPDARYVVFGSGEDESRLREQSTSLGVASHIVWAGYRNDVQDLLPALDVFVFPSLREAMGISIVEAMAAGLPSVATRTGGIPEVLGEGTGIIVPPADPFAMADAMSTLLREPELRAQFGAAAYDRGRTEYTVTRMSSRTVGVYRAILNRARAH